MSLHSRIPSHRPPWTARLVASMLGAVVLAAVAGQSLAVPERGRPAPPFKLTDLDGRTVTLTDQPGTTLVLVFGELYHQPTREAVREIGRILEDPRLVNERIAPLLIIAHDLPVAELRHELEEAGLQVTVLHDPSRRAFGDYRIKVMPSVVVIDPKRLVVAGIAGKTARFGDIVRDALLVATGQLSEERFAETLHPGGGPSKSEGEVRAERLTRLGDQLVGRRLNELAQQKYLEALELLPDHAPARLGLGRLLLQEKRIADAETQFRQVLLQAPDSVEAALGLAYVQTLRGGDELNEAERIVREVISRQPAQPRAHYLLGLIHEHRNELAEASASFKRAAELLLER